MTFEFDPTQVDPDADLCEETQMVYHVLESELGREKALTLTGRLMQALGGNRVFIQSSRSFEQRQRIAFAASLLAQGRSELDVHVRSGLPVRQLRKMRPAQEPAGKATA